MLLAFSYFLLQGKVLCFTCVGTSLSRCLFLKRSEDLVAFSRNERTHPYFVSQAPEIQIFCEDCKLAPPLGFFRGFGLVVEYIVPGDEVDACVLCMCFSCLSFELSAEIMLDPRVEKKSVKKMTSKRYITFALIATPHTQK